MVQLFNHGISPTELYSVNLNGKKVIDRTYSWLSSNNGGDQTWERMLCKPFKYCIGLIFTDMIENSIRFKVPDTKTSYFDFEVVHEHDFKIQRGERKRFKDIDYIETGFTGYCIRYYYKSKAYEKSIPIYPSSELRSRFYELINDGKKYYTIIEKNINDYLEEVNLEFPFYEREELKKLLVHGFRRMASALRYGCAMTFSSANYIKYNIHIGWLSSNRKRYLTQYSFTRTRKLRKVYTWKRTEFDGYYYIGLYGDKFLDWVETNKKTRTVISFENIFARKIESTLYYRAPEIHIFRFKLPKWKGFEFWIDNKKFKNVEYVGRCEKTFLTDTNITIKQLINKYETRST